MVTRRRRRAAVGRHSDPADRFPDTPTPTPTETPSPIDADLNRDGKVDEIDLFIFLKQWYKNRTGKGAEQASDGQSDESPEDQ